MVVISWDTGRVLDSYVLNKQCTKCARKSGQYPEDSLEYQQWYARHKDSCSINHTGSSPAMEMEGAKVLWNLSVKRLNLRYKNVVSDGDSKTVVALNELEPYGPGVRIVKFECVGHVQKRLGAAIIKLRTNPPTEVVEVVTQKGVTFRKATKMRPVRKAVPEITKMVPKHVVIGGLTGISKPKYISLQQFYGNAIREHAGDIEGMVVARWAVYYHTISTDTEPQHDHCPKHWPRMSHPQHI